MRVTVWRALSPGIATVVLGLGVITADSGSATAGELHILTWEGYTDPSFVSIFENASGCKVTSTFAGSTDEFAAKLAAGGAGNYDLSATGIDATHVINDMGIVEPIDVSRIERWNEVYDFLREHPGVNAGGTILALPWAWGVDLLMYRTDMIAAEPTSVAALWDPAQQGKVSMWDDKSTLYWGALALYGKGFDVYTMTDDQLGAVKQKLIEQKPLIRQYWATAGELVDLYAKGEVWISNTWGGYQSALLAEQGIPVKEFAPEEGSFGWVDNWQVIKGTPNLDCIYAWLNFALSSDAQCGMVKVTGYAGVNPAALRGCLTEEEFKSRHQDDEAFLQRLSIYQKPPRIDVYINTWNAVKASPN